MGHRCNKKELSVLVTQEEDEDKMDDKLAEGDGGEVASVVLEEQTQPEISLYSEWIV